MTRQRAGRVSWKTLWSVVAPLLAGVFAAVALLIDVPPWLAATLCLAAAVAVAWAARSVAYRSPMFRVLDSDAQRSVAGWLAGAGVAYATWACAAVLAPHMWPVWVTALPALGGLTYVGARANEYVLTKWRPAGRSRPVLELTAAPAAGLPVLPEPHPGEPRLVWQLRQCLAISGLGWLQVVDREEIRVSGRVIGYTLRVRCPLEIQIPGGNGQLRTARKPRPPKDTDQLLSQAFSELTGLEMSADLVQIAPHPRRSGDLHVTVTTEDPFTEVRPYLHDPETLPWVNSCRDRVAVAYDQYGRGVSWDWAHHGRLVGGTQYGKSSAILRLLEVWSRCRDTVVWAGSTEKFYDLIGPVISRYQGSEYRPPVDWMAWTPEGILEMLIAAMRIVHWRQRQPHKTRDQHKHLFLILDEVSFAAQDRTTYGRYGKERVNVSKMIAMLAKAGESAGVHLLIASQRAVQTHQGDHGGDVTPNLGWQIALPTGERQDTGRAIGEYKLSPLRNPGQAYISARGQDITCVRFEYMQDDDASKPRLHDGPRVSEVFWGIRRFQRDLDEGSQRAAGPVYAAREQYVTDALITALQGGDQDIDQPSAATGEDTSMRDVVRQILKIKGVKLPGTAAPAPPAGVATLTAHRTREDMIIQMLTEHGPLVRADIIARVRDVDPRAGQVQHYDQVIQNQLSKLVKATRITRDDHGRYNAA